jgi:hypothetical protein
MNIKTKVGLVLLILPPPSSFLVPGPPSFLPSSELHRRRHPCPLLGASLRAPLVRLHETPNHKNEHRNQS